MIKTELNRAGYAEFIERNRLKLSTESNRANSLEHSNRVKLIILRLMETSIRIG